MAVPTISAGDVRGVSGGTARVVEGGTVSHDQRKVLLAPPAADGVDITAADTAGLDLDVHVVVAERLWLELVLVELCPSLGSVDLKAGKLVGVRHLAAAGDWNSRQWAMMDGRIKGDNIHNCKDVELAVEASSEERGKITDGRHQD